MTRSDLAFAMLLLALTAPLRAADVAGASDHPLIKRYADAELYHFRETAFDEYHLLVKPATSYGGKEKNLDSTRKLEGRVTERGYRLEAGRSTLEVFRNYRDELEAAGFAILWQCSNLECGGRNFNHAVIPYQMGFGGNDEDQRYLAAHLQRPEGDLYVSLYVVRNYSVGGATKNMIYARLDTVELEPMEARMVTVKAEEMRDEIERDGHIALYGIYFDTDKTEVKRESDPTLQEIARLLAADKSLMLWVVGHTDNQGSAAYNLDLSERRASAVVASLVERVGVDAARLSAQGVGLFAPVASNANEAGRALNRRVELIPRLAGH